MGNFSVIIFFLLAAARTPCCPAAFAGGFGAGKQGSKTKRSQSKQKKGILSEIQSSTVKSSNKLRDEPQLDRWGLPIPSLEEVFPPMRHGTELVPVDPNVEYSLDEIEHCLRSHADLRLNRFFDENGIEKSKRNDSPREPMSVKLLHKSPPVLVIENFFAAEDCVEMKEATKFAHKIDSATFTGAISTRTSTSWFCQFVNTPTLLAKANKILNMPLESMEEPQVVRYKKGQEFSWHYDEVPSEQLHNGGQRLSTLLVYLNDIAENTGGGTMFRDLTFDGEPLVMHPRQGSALLFFPAFRDGTPDDRTLHKSEVMTSDDEKWIVQMWAHSEKYQAVIPPGNSNEAARFMMEECSKQLGYHKL